MSFLSYFLKTFFMVCFFLMLSSCNDNDSSKEPPESTESTTPGINTSILIENNIQLSCVWIRKREFDCDGTAYILGFPSCKSPHFTHQSLFCKKAYENNITACLQDQSPETQLCHQKHIGRHLP